MSQPPRADGLRGVRRRLSAAMPAAEGAYRAAVIARENALRATRANAEETASLEIEDSQVNQRDMFLPPQSAPAAQQAAAAPAPTTPAATPASQPQ